MMRVMPMLAVALGLCGCASLQPDAAAGATPAPTASSRGPNWEEIDKSVQRVREREQKRTRLVETGRNVEHGFFPMSDEDYAAALDAAREEVRKQNPKMAEGDVEKEATKRADEAKRGYESSHTTRASSTYELSKP